MSYFEIHSLKHLGRENTGFRLYRPNGSGDYVFVHFLTPVLLTLQQCTYQTMPGACLIYSPSCCHDFRVVNEPLVHNWIHFDISDSDIFQRCCLTLDTIFYPGNDSRFTETTKRMELEFLNRHPLWDLRTSGLMMYLLASLGQHTKEDSRNAAIDNEELRSKFESLRLDIYNTPSKWNVDRMASSIGLSRSRFSVLYRIFFSTSPGADQNVAALERAKYMLSTTRLKVSNVARDIGYESQEYFIRWFKENTGMSPGQYRNVRSKTHEQ